MYIYKGNSYDRVINYDVMRSIDPPCNSHLPYQNTKANQLENNPYTIYIVQDMYIVHCTASEYTSKPTTKQSVHYMYSTERVHCTLYSIRIHKQANQKTIRTLYVLYRTCTLYIVQHQNTQANQLQNNPYTICIVQNVYVVHCTVSEYTSKPTRKQSVHCMYCTEQLHCTLYSIRIHKQTNYKTIHTLYVLYRTCTLYIVQHQNTQANQLQNNPYTVCIVQNMYIVHCTASEYASKPTRTPYTVCIVQNMYIVHCTALEYYVLRSIVHICLLKTTVSQISLCTFHLSIPSCIP